MKPADLANRAYSWVRYQIVAHGRHGVHSPFVYSLLEDCIYKKRFPINREVKKLKKDLLRDHGTITMNDFGAGGTDNPVYEIPISKITRRTSKPFKYSNLISRIVNYFEPRVFIEMGTAVGLTTSMVAINNPKTTIITIEGSPELFNLAQDNFNTLKLKNIDPRCGTFDDLLPEVLKEVRVLEMLYLDGNHRLEPTWDYIETILPYCDYGTLLIFDDIHWSVEMEKAWKRIRKSSAFHLTIDLYSIGLAFILEGRGEKEHFTIRY